jgi:hypothetical protein
MLRLMKALKSSFFCCLFLITQTYAFASEGNDSVAHNASLDNFSGQIFHYTLRYRGLLTSMIWADLADISIQFSKLSDHSLPLMDKKPVYEFSLHLTTQNYMKAELFQAVRYTYKTLLDNKLNTLLVEESDMGDKQSHKFLWLDWQNKTLELFKRREKIRLETDFISFSEPKIVWEKDGKIPLPSFLNTISHSQNKPLDLIHKKTGDDINVPSVRDPLSLIYTIRMQASNISPPPLSQTIAIAVSDDIRLYHIKKEAQESLSINQQNIAATKYQIHSDEKEADYFYLWLSDDQKKIPLKMAMDATLGEIEINLLHK